MKRNMDLVREILLYLEELPQGLVNAEDLRSKFSDQSVLDHHLELMRQSQLIQVRVWEEEQGSPPIYQRFVESELQPIIVNREIRIDWSCVSISWAGHEFLDAARDGTVWNKTKKTIADQVKSVSFDILISLLKTEARTRLGLPV